MKSPRRTSSPLSYLFLLLAALACLAGDLIGQVEAWRATYSGPGDGWDTPAAIARDRLGNTYVTGTSEGVVTDNWDYATIKYDPEGTELWVARYDGLENGIDEAGDIVVDRAGNVYVTGSSTDRSPDFATIKYDTDGNEVWAVTYDGPDNNIDRGTAIALDGFGHVIVTGRSHSDTNDDFATIQYDDDGNEIWVARYNGPFNSVDIAWALAVDDSGNVYVTGESQGLSSSYDYATVKYDSDGVERWVARYSGTAGDDDYPADIVIGAEGNVYVTGHAQELGSGTDYVTIKYDSAGNELWIRRYNGPGNGGDVATAIAAGPDAGLCVTGMSDRGAGTLFDFVTVQYDSEGNELWVARYDSPGSRQDRAYDVVIDHMGNVYVTGQSGHESTFPDFVTIKYNSDGHEMWQSRFNGPSDRLDTPVEMYVDKCERVVVTGFSRVETGLYDLPAVTYDFSTVMYVPIDLSVSAIPDTTEFHPGDSLHFTAILTNDTDSALSLDAWTEVGGPGGQNLSPSLGPVEVMIGSGVSISRDFCQPIPGNTPVGGPYGYNVKVGEYPDRVLAAGHFEFFIIARGR